LLKLYRIGPREAGSKLRWTRKKIENPKDLVKVHESIQTTMKVIVGYLQGRDSRVIQQLKELAYPPNWRFLKNLPLEDPIPKTSQWLTIPKDVEGSLLILTVSVLKVRPQSMPHKINSLVTF
jgi:hypothetical protein